MNTGLSSTLWVSSVTVTSRHCALCAFQMSAWGDSNVTLKYAEHNHSISEEMNNRDYDRL